jgi:hypothetical protein
MEFLGLPLALQSTSRRDRNPVGGSRGHNDAYRVHCVTALTAVGDVVRQGSVKQTGSYAGRSACRAACAPPPGPRLGRSSSQSVQCTPVSLAVWAGEEKHEKTKKKGNFFLGLHVQ